MGRIVSEYDPDEDPMGKGAPGAEPEWTDPRVKAGPVPNSGAIVLSKEGRPVGIIAPDGSTKTYGGLTSFSPISSVNEDDEDEVVGTIGSYTGSATMVASTTVNPSFVRAVYGGPIAPEPPSTSAPGTSVVRSVPGPPTSAFRSGGGGPRFAPRLDTTANELNFFRQFAAYLLEMVGGSIVLNDQELIDLMEARKTIYMQDNLDKNTTTYKIMED